MSRQAEADRKVELKEMEDELVRLSAMYALTRSKRTQAEYKALHKRWVHDKKQGRLW